MFIVETKDGTQVTEDEIFWLDIEFPIKRLGVGDKDNIQWLEGAVKYGQLKDRAFGLNADINLISQYIFAQYPDGTTKTIRYCHGKHYEYKAIPFTLNKNIWREGIGSSN